ncbi:MAG: Cof-type HAD-IIB family hydrolase [Pyrinomonadaceae bacterium]
MKIKLLALDLDGTLLNSKGKIPEANKIAIRNAEELGVLVTIATGRRFRDALPVAAELEFNAPLITHNGALLKFADSLETVAASLLNLDTSLEILRVGKEFGGDALVSVDPYGKGTLLFDTVSDDNIPLQKYIRWSESLHGDGAQKSVIHVKLLAEELTGNEVIHISFSGGCASMGEMVEVLKAELGNTVTLLSTIYPKLDFTLLDILPPNASKGHGVEKLAAINGLASENVMVIGDNFNDLEMLEFAGTAVVMGNASPDLLKTGDYHRALSNDENGVAFAIDKFILNQ